MVSLICSCGHLDTDHANRIIGTPDIPKADCFYVDMDGSFCDCRDFRLDNLLYLEQLERESYYANSR